MARGPNRFGPETREHVEDIIRDLYDIEPKYRTIDEYVEKRGIPKFEFTDPNSGEAEDKIVKQILHDKRYINDKYKGTSPDKRVKAVVKECEAELPIVLDSVFEGLVENMWKNTEEALGDLDQDILVANVVQRILTLVASQSIEAKISEQLARRGTKRPTHPTSLTRLDDDTRSISSMNSVEATGLDAIWFEKHFKGLADSMVARDAAAKLRGWRRNGKHDDTKSVSSASTMSMGPEHLQTLIDDMNERTERLAKQREKGARQKAEALGITRSERAFDDDDLESVSTVSSTQILRDFRDSIDTTQKIMHYTHGPEKAIGARGSGKLARLPVPATPPPSSASRTNNRSDDKQPPRRDTTGGGGARDAPRAPARGRDAPRPAR